MIKIPIVFAFSNEYAVPGWISIASLVNTAKNEVIYLIHVLHDGLDKYHKRNIFKRIKKTRHEVFFNDISDYLSSSDKIYLNQNWPKILYARLFVTDFFPNYKKIIVSDVDILFKKDLSEIFLNDLSEYHYGLVPVENRIQSNIGHKRYEFYNNDYIYYSGFVIYNTERMKNDKICERFKESLNKYKNILKNDMTDLIILNMCSNLIFNIPLNYCVLESLLIKKNVKDISEYNFLSQLYKDDDLEKFRNDPAIIHYTGHGEHRERPWKRISPPKEYLKYINESPYKFEWVADRNLKKFLRSNDYLLNLSNSRIYKRSLESIFSYISLIIARFFCRKN